MIPPPQAKGETVAERLKLVRSPAAPFRRRVLGREPERRPALSPRESCRQPGERLGLHQGRRDWNSTSCVLDCSRLWAHSWPRLWPIRGPNGRKVGRIDKSRMHRDPAQLRDLVTRRHSRLVVGEPRGGSSPLIPMATTQSAPDTRRCGGRLGVVSCQASGRRTRPLAHPRRGGGRGAEGVLLVRRVSSRPMSR